MLPEPFRAASDVAVSILFPLLKNSGILIQGILGGTTGGGTTENQWSHPTVVPLDSYENAGKNSIAAGKKIRKAIRNNKNNKVPPSAAPQRGGRFAPAPLGLLFLYF